MKIKQLIKYFFLRPLRFGVHCDKFLFLIFLIILVSCNKPNQPITTASLLSEMTDLSRLSQLSEVKYHAVQFSSYDRRSTDPSEPFWFANDDGFGGETIPGFEEVLKQPGEDGIGEYLICDIQKPGAILRLWTARISGVIRFYLDDMDNPVYEGNAEDFFWKTIEAVTGSAVKMDSLNAYRQFDAIYFPIAFSKACRIVWIGNLKDTHFYHVGVRVYDEEVEVETFNPDKISDYFQFVKEIHNEFENPQQSKNLPDNVDVNIPPSTKTEIFQENKSSAIDGISIRVDAKDYESVLRKNILRIYFDNSEIPQVQSPLGDFFISAPGINSYQSLAFSVGADSTLQCKFIMPYKNSVRIEIENNSEETVRISGVINTSDYNWKDGKSMHFWAQWKIEHDLTAQNINDGIVPISDILYLNAQGSGRIVGAATHIYNPSNVPTSWGNWWGEGDEKIFIDQDNFPSFFGTGSEDYYNYSWSSAEIFSYPYCGQPKNDGPGNRGYVSNYRLHIIDDIPFQDSLQFFMELGHHGVVPGFSYGRIVYFYALPGIVTDYKDISDDDIRDFVYQDWQPVGYGGSGGYNFIQAEELIKESSTVKLEKGNIYSSGSIVMWKPKEKGERVSFRLNSDKTDNKFRVGMTLAHSPDGGKFSVLVNGKIVKFGVNEIIDLYKPFQNVLDNHFSETVTLKKGVNEIVFIAEDVNKNIGIDFIWKR